MTDPIGLLTRTRLLEVMERHGLEPHRTLGQNFVIDQNTIRKIVRVAGVSAGDRVIEIGPGLGSLTLGLMEVGAEVRAVEIDSRLLDALHENTNGAVEVTNADAMTLDWATVTRGQRWAVVANLPYNVATPVVLRILDTAPEIDRIVVMVQKEVAERLAAGPGTKAYGIPSVKVAYWATARLLGTVGAEVFHPQPRVTSALVEIVRRPSPAVEADADTLFDLVRGGFGQRRKTIRRALAGRVTDEQFAAAGIDPVRRAEELTITEWGALARAVRPVA